MRRWLALGGAGCVAVAAAVACSDTSVHILSGQLYDPQGMCLGPVSGVDVLSGAGGGDGCPPECLVADVADASAVYISTTCPPVSTDYAVESSDQARDASDPCFGAFAALEADASCGTEGGSPEAASEAGPDAAPDAGTDASALDASTDAGADAGATDASAD